MSRVTIDTNKVWDIGKASEATQKRTIELADALQGQVKSLTHIEDFIQLYDERLCRQIRRMKNEANRCGMAASYIFKIAENYEGVDKGMTSILTTLNVTTTLARSENDDTSKNVINQLKYLDFYINLRDNNSFSTLNAKRETVLTIFNQLAAEGYEPAFIAGILGNICHEGTIGKFESSSYLGNNASNKPNYLKYVDAKYNYASKYSGKNVKDVSLSQLYSFICELEKDGFKGKFGLGSIQWTGGRTKRLVENYIKIAGNSDTITISQIMEAECLTISEELKSKDYNYIYEKWKKSNSNIIDSSLAAKSAGELVCKEYERPKDTQAYKTRSQTAARLYDIMIGQ